jgi:polysaccharide deacetylase family protein (PEP-CTERM system associated)
MIKKNIMSIDVEDWYSSSLDLFKDSDIQHGNKPDPSIVTNTRHSLEMLRKTENSGTFFILGTVAEHYPDLVKEILDSGHEVATHGYGHNLVYKLDEKSFAEDLEKSLGFLGRAGCSDVIGYRAPYWSITKKSLWALDVLKKFGFCYDSSIFPIRRKLYGIPDARTEPYKHDNGLWEFPPATYRFFGINIPIAGGGYLRLAPYSLIKRAIEKNQSQNTKVFYFHPYELDPSDVEMKHKVKSMVSFIYWIQQIVGRKDNPQKLKKLIEGYDFVSFVEVLKYLE